MMKTTNEEVQNKRSLTKGIIAIACACALALVGVFAYLTATDQVKNIFGFADKLDIEVVEPNWDPANAQNLLPTQTVTKDPALHNPNKADVYVFADVVIPQKDIVTANADGTLNESAVVDLFSYELNDGWTLKDTLAGDDGTVTYRCVYNDVVPAGETSGSIFDQVAIVNYVNEQFNTEELAQQIVINGYASQATGFESVDAAYQSYFGETEKTIVTDITVNDDSIVAASEYEVKQVETMSVASLSTAQVDDQVVFEDVELVEDAKYAIVPAGASVDNAIAEFTADEATVAESANGLLLDNLPKTAFAVYSADDNSLNFYKRSSIPAAGEQFSGKTVSKVYKGFENSNFVYDNQAPWAYDQASILSVNVVDQDIKLKGPQTTGFLASLKSCKTMNLSKLDVSGVSNMSGMFYGCSALTDLNVQGWDTSNVTNFKEMFYGCSSLEEVNLNTWNMSSAANLDSMFRGCYRLNKIDIDQWNTSNVTNISRLFYGCEALTDVNVSCWNTKKVENATSAFNQCKALTTLDLSGWNTSSCKDMQTMFYNCPKLATIYVSEAWTTASVQTSSMMFTGSTSLIGGSGTKYQKDHTDLTYARVDGLNGQPGYFTAK